MFNYNEIIEIVNYLADLFEEAAQNAFEEEELLESFSTAFTSEESLLLLLALSDFEFPDPEIEKLKIALFIHFEEAISEGGHTPMSVFKAIDRYHLFGLRLLELRERINHFFE